MEAARRWCVWKKVERDGKTTKAPYSAGDGRPVAVTEEVRACSRYDTAVLALKSGKFDGLGFVLGKEDDKAFVGVDIDHCRNPETGEFDDGILETVHGLGSYAEISPSGTGVHIIGYGEKPPGAGSRKGPIEIYEKDRYFTVSGQHIDGTPTDICAFNPAEFAAVCEMVTAPPPQGERVAPQPCGRSQSRLTDDEVIRLLCTDRSREALFNGDTSAHGGDDSAADIALCNHLAYWTNGDAFQMDRIFRRSGLVREKWKRDDYRELTINNALKDTPNGYEPPDYETGEAAATAFLKKDGEVQAEVVQEAEFVVPFVPPDQDAPPEELLTVPGVLNDVADYATKHNWLVNREADVAAALAVGSVALARRYSVNGMFTNLYIMVVGDSSSGKNAGIEAANAILEAARREGDDGYVVSKYKSESGLFDEFVKRAKHLCIIDEFGQYFSSRSANGNLQDVLSKLTALYKPNPTDRRGSISVLTHKPKEYVDTVMYPTPCLYFTTTGEALFKRMHASEVLVGFVPRFICVCPKTDKPRRNPAFDSTAPVPESVAPWIQSHNPQMTTKGGGVSMNNGGMEPEIIEIEMTSTARGMYDAFVDAELDRQACARDEVTRTAIGKRSENAARLALIIALSCGEEVIDGPHMRWAIRYVSHYGDRFVKMLGAELAESDHERTANAVAEYIRKAASNEKGAARCVTFRQLCQNVRPLKAGDVQWKRRVIESALLDNPDLHSVTVKAGNGAPVVKYFHRLRGNGVDA